MGVSFCSFQFRNGVTKTLTELASGIQNQTRATRRTEYIVGVMQTPVERADEVFADMVTDAVAMAERILTEQQISLQVDLFQFEGPHVRPTGGAYAPVDFLQIGLVEKLERKPHFLLVVTEVDLSSTIQNYVVALPSTLTNIGIISTKRLRPAFWGEPDNAAVAVQRLAVVLLHTLGHLLNLEHAESPDNIMHSFESVSDLDAMQVLTPEQAVHLKRRLPREAREQLVRQGSWWVAVRWILSHWLDIWQAVLRANPFDLVLRMPTMVTAAISLIVVVFFSAETWDVAGTVALAEVGLFSGVALAVGTAVLYRAHGLNLGQMRSKALSESVIITRAATVFSLLCTLGVFYVFLLVVVYAATQTVFPQRLMETWPTVDPATRTLDHIKLSMFLAALGVLGGSLGGSAESKALVRHILFLDEET